MIANDSTVTTPAVIQVENLDHFFGEGDLKKQVLFEVNLSIQAGEIVILTGPSGLRMLDTELVGAAKAVAVKARRSCGYIFQAHNLHTSLTAQDNVMMGLEVSGIYPRPERRNLALNMLSVVGLADRTQYYPEDLSGGQKQRVAIARALVSHPQIVLADEPTAALDKKSGRDVVELMQKLAKEQGCTILMVTHDSRILDVADRIIYMEDGHLVGQPE
jgi:putative ABC transport system ATP-binding protein